MAEPMRYRITIEATGEVRDKDGNLVETVPMEHVVDLSAEELEQYLNNLKE